MVEKIIDANEKAIKVGDKVKVSAFDPKTDDHSEAHGVIVKITDLDGDVDDEGRTVAYYPQVYVKFDSGDEDYFTTSSTQQWMDDELEFQCDDLEKVEEENANT